MLASRVNDSKDLRERAAEMRASSKELKDDNTATVILRLGWSSTTGSPSTPRAAAMVACRQVLRLSADAIGGTWPPSPVRCAACFNLHCAERRSCGTVAPD